MSAEEMPPAGPKRDAAIAELLGWRRCIDPEHMAAAAERPHFHDWYSPRGLTANHTSIPRYSTDNHAALDLLLEMQERGWNATVHLLRSGASQCSLRCDGTTHLSFAVLSFPDAVSAAVLRALRAETESKEKEDAKTVPVE